MKIQLFTTIFFLILTVHINAQPNGINDVNLGVQLGSITGSKNVQSYSLTTNCHCSLFDYIINGKNNKFRFGDYLGFRATTGIPTLTAAFDLGLQAAYGTERMNLGFKYIYKIDATSQSDLSGLSKYWGLNTRVEDLYLELLFGKEDKTNINGFGLIFRFMAKKNAYYGFEYNAYPLNYRYSIDEKYAKLFSINMGWMF